MQENWEKIIHNLDGGISLNGKMLLISLTIQCPFDWRFWKHFSHSVTCWHSSSTASQYLLLAWKNTCILIQITFCMNSEKNQEFQKKVKNTLKNNSGFKKRAFFVCLVHSLHHFLLVFLPPHHREKIVLLPLVVDPWIPIYTLLTKVQNKGAPKQKIHLKYHSEYIKIATKHLANIQKLAAETCFTECILL